VALLLATVDRWRSCIVMTDAHIDTIDSRRPQPYYHNALIACLLCPCTCPSTGVQRTRFRCYSTAANSKSHYSAGRYASAEYWIYSTGQFDGVQCSRVRLYLRRNWTDFDKIWSTMSTLLEVDSGEFWARSGQ